MEDTKPQNSRAQRRLTIADAIRRAVIDARSRTAPLTIEETLALAQKRIDALDKAQNRITMYEYDSLVKAVQHEWEKQVWE